MKRPLRGVATKGTIPKNLDKTSWILQLTWYIFVINWYIFKISTQTFWDNKYDNVFIKLWVPIYFICLGRGKEAQRASGESYGQAQAREG